MNYFDMEDVKALLDANYVAGDISREIYNAAVKGLHAAYATSNGYGRCACSSCGN